MKHKTITIAFFAAMIAFPSFGMADVRVKLKMCFVKYTGISLEKVIGASYHGNDSSLQIAYKTCSSYGTYPKKCTLKCARRGKGYCKVRATYRWKKNSSSGSSVERYITKKVKKKQWMLVWNLKNRKIKASVHDSEPSCPTAQ